MNTYAEFIERKSQIGGMSGFEPLFMPGFLFDFQKHLIDWALRKGRSAVFADCGLGKTPMQLVWAQNVVEKTNKPVLILAPLAVGSQTVREAEKFNIDCAQSRGGAITSKIVVTNYQRLKHFDWKQFAAVACDESSVLKNFDGAIKSEVTEFMRKVPLRLLCSATPSPNDYIELGTSSEALGELGYIEMLKMFFKANDDSYAHGGGGNGARRFSKQPFGGKFRFRGHAGKEFWRWVCSWARAIRQPSDIGFSDDKFKLPALVTKEHIVKSKTTMPGYLIDLPAMTLKEQRSERRRTLDERCEMAAQLAQQKPDEASVLWCHLNGEGELLAKLIPDSVNVEGKDDDDFKEEAFNAFASGKLKKLISKPTIAGYGLNWQHCCHQTFFPSHSYEQFYQGVRRCWRFGQKRSVTVDVIASEGEAGVLRNMNRKSEAASAMFSRIVSLMNDELNIKPKNQNTQREEIPTWL